MQLFNAVPILLLWLQAATTAPALLVPRQANIMQGAISKLMTALQNLDGAIKNVGPDVNSALPLLNLAQAAQKSFDEAGQDIQKSQKLSLVDSVGLIQPAQGLVTMVKTTLGDLTQKKPVFDQLGVSSTVADVLKQQKAASTQLSGALLSKLPDIAQGFANGTINDLIKSVDDAINTFQAPPAGAPAAALPAPVASPQTPPALTAPAAPIVPAAPPKSPAAPAIAPAAPAIAPAAPAAAPAVPAAVAALAALAVPAALSGGVTTATQ